MIIKNLSVAVFFSVITFMGTEISAQNDTILIRNASLEGEPKAGSFFSHVFLKDWIDCTPYLFPKNTPPDIHPGGFFNVTKEPKDGKTYVGLVARDDHTWEAISQKLEQPLEKGHCYSIELHLARSENYLSRHYKDNANESVLIKKGNRLGTSKSNANESQNLPLIFTLYGGTSACDGILLTETQAIEHLEWKKYSLTFQATEDMEYLTFSVYYRSEEIPPYKGNLLLDQISPIVIVPCK
ncbi:hypothetical protein [Portibacter marinus]|uniref:hypothetical protein n=1 Tax=Portibacter marinus TaxID=2898660 RepID=UPI001F1A872F|nr:hypothetical protein [Portibacter marinus]